MNSTLYKYSISPRVLKANQKQRICFYGLDSSVVLFNQLEYQVKIVRKYDWKYAEDIQFDKLAKQDFVFEYTIKPIDRKLYIEHYFEGESEWTITITPIRTEDLSFIPDYVKKFFPWNVAVFFRPIVFSVYSINDDLYGKKPFKGDLHIHSNGSDGIDSPLLVASQYRRLGYDFICLTDHWRQEPSNELVEKIKDVNTPFKVFPGEEVHVTYGSTFHVVNFNGSSANKNIQDDKETFNKKIENIADTLTDIQDVNLRKSIATLKAMADEIKNAGGISIFPHPLWLIDGTLHLNPAVTEEVLKRKIFDVFEILGGTDVQHNRLQEQLYLQCLKNGFDYPIVGSSDSHHTIYRIPFDRAFTIAFAKNSNEIPNAILNKYSVAVENFNDKIVFGDLRLAKYAYFLINNYYVTHDDLCSSIGQAFNRYAFGEKEQNELIKLLENEVDKFDKQFFGY